MCTQTQEPSLQHGTYLQQLLTSHGGERVKNTLFPVKYISAQGPGAP